ncbi:MAG: transcription antitermination factor NusB [Gammaproteobacteria bacterium]|nr:transcription antitermination factor NusB [Gammaproteobacteria bacterium]
MNLSARRKARQLALQAIYQWQHDVGYIDEIKEQFIEKSNPKKADLKYFAEIVSGVVSNLEKIDATIEPKLDRKLTALNPVELAIIRLATFELLFRDDIPYKVVINEALENTKTYGAQEGYKYVNGILDKIAQDLPNKF